MANLRKILLNRKVLCLAGWVAAFLLLLGGAAGRMADLMTADLAGESQEVRSARRKLQEIEKLAAAPQLPESAGIDLDRVLALPAPGPASSAGAMATAAAMDGEPEALPAVTGILRVQDVGGKVRFRALIDGRDVGVKGKVGGFTVERISDSGVTLIRDGRRWSLAAPEIAYSLRQE